MEPSSISSFERILATAKKDSLWREALGLFYGYFLGGRYGLSKEEILSAAKCIEERGTRDFHLGGGTTLGNERKEVVEGFRAIPGWSTKSLVTVNGKSALSRDSIIELKELGMSVTS